MYGVSDARGAVAKPREGRVTTCIVPRYQDNPGAHFSKFNGGHLAYSGRAAGDDNSLSPHKRLGNYFSVSQGCCLKTAPSSAVSGSNLRPASLRIAGHCIVRCRRSMSTSIGVPPVNFGAPKTDITEEA